VQQRPKVPVVTGEPFDITDGFVLRFERTISCHQCVQGLTTRTRENIFHSLQSQLLDSTASLAAQPGFIGSEFGIQSRPVFERQSLLLGSEDRSDRFFVQRRQRVGPSGIHAVEQGQRLFSVDA